jgi:flagellar FliJ protein
MANARKLDRIHRVRTLQLGQVRAQEVMAREKVVQEETLRARIAQLSANVAPAEAQEMATSLKAAAHYRERLHQSAIAAERRVEVAEQSLSVAENATREAKRDQSAVEKLIARSQAAATLKEMRALEELPPSSRKRHDLC